MFKRAFLVLLTAVTFISSNNPLYSDDSRGIPLYIQKAALKEIMVPVVTLQTSEGPLKTAGPTSALIASVNDDETVYIVNGLTGEVEAHKNDPALSTRPFAHTVGPLAVRSSEYFAYIDEDSKVTLAEPKGRILSKINTPPAISVDFLSYGNIVVASPTKKHFLHMYTSTGKLLRSFGAVKKRISGDHAENNFLHKGKVLVDAADNIYYVYYYIPLIQKFTPAGELDREIEVKGNAIDIQQELAQRFFSNRKPDMVGGVTIITSAAIDYKSGHLWIGLNGSSSSGVVYEYAASGQKLREYDLQVNSQSAMPEVITGVKDIAITTSKLYVVTNQYQVFHFAKSGGSAQSTTSRSGRRSKKESYSIRPVAWISTAGKPVLSVQGTCGTAQAWDPCGFTCPGPVCNGTTPTTTSSNSAPLDCKTALQNSISSPYVVINANCTTYPAGTAMHMRGGCTSFVRICKVGQNSDHTLTIDCQAPDCSAGGLSCCDFCFVGGGFCEDFGDGRCSCMGSPILIDTLGNGFSLTDVSSGVNFDLDGEGGAERLAWTTADSDDALLVLDRDGSGTIDNGAELFGNYTSQPQSTNRNGFLALGEYDKTANGGNGDGKIDSRDAIFSSLRLWKDTSHNGISESSELHTLLSLGVVAIDLDYKTSRRTDQYGNRFRYRAKTYDARGAHVGRWAWDVFLVRAP